MTDGLTDLVYEAAFRPDLWPEALHGLAERAESMGGVLQVVRPGEAPRWTVSPGVRAPFETYVREADFAASHDRAARWMRRGHTFLRDVDVYDSLEDIAADPPCRMLVRLGLGWQVGACLPMPTGDSIGVTFERPFSEGPHSSAARDRLNDSLHHLSRAAMVAARLGLEVAQAQVDLLEQLGLPAAVLRFGGQVLAMNGALERLEGLIAPAAFDRLSLALPAQNRRLADAVERMRTGGDPLSIPLRAGDDRGPQVLHLLPLHKSARDLFRSGDLVLVVTPLVAARMVPAVETLCGLFDLTPAESRLAAALAGGQSLAEAAAAAQITLKTARTYLERVFEKTVTHQQSQLVALLKSAPVLTPPATA